MDKRLRSIGALGLLGASLVACSQKKTPHQAPSVYRAAGDLTCDRYIATTLRCIEATMPETDRGHALRTMRHSVYVMLTSVVDLRSGDSTVGSICDTFREADKGDLAAQGCTSTDDVQEVIAAGSQTEPIGVPVCDAYVASQRKCIAGRIGQALRPRFPGDGAVVHEQNEMMYYLNIWADLMRRDVLTKRAYSFEGECEGLVDIAKKHDGCFE